MTKERNERLELMTLKIISNETTSRWSYRSVYTIAQYNSSTTQKVDAKS